MNEKDKKQKEANLQKQHNDMMTRFNHSGATPSITGDQPRNPEDIPHNPYRNDMEVSDDMRVDLLEKGFKMAQRYTDITSEQYITDMKESDHKEAMEIARVDMVSAMRSIDSAWNLHLIEKACNEKGDFQSNIDYNSGFMSKPAENTKAYYQEGIKIMEKHERSLENVIKDYPNLISSHDALQVFRYHSQDLIKGWKNKLEQLLANEKWNTAMNVSNPQSDMAEINTLLKSKQKVEQDVYERFQLRMDTMNDKMKKDQKKYGLFKGDIDDDEEDEDDDDTKDKKKKSNDKKEDFTLDEIKDNYDKKHAAKMSGDTDKTEEDDDDEDDKKKKSKKSDKIKQDLMKAKSEGDVNGFYEIEGDMYYTDKNGDLFRIDLEDGYKLKMDKSDR